MTTLPRKFSRASIVTVLAAAGVFAFALANVVVPSAQAATITYANNVSTPMGVEVSSGLRPKITGSDASVVLGFGTVTVKEYNPAPGYKVHYQATASAAGVARTSHAGAPLTNAYSKCSWKWENVGGNAKLNCSVRG